MSSRLYRFRRFFPKFCFWFVVGIGFFISSWLLFLSINDGLGLTNPRCVVLTFLITFFFGVGVYFFYVYRPEVFRSDKLYIIIIFYLSLVAGLILRLIFLKFSPNYFPTGETTDTGVHWYGAQEILATGHLTSPNIGLYEAYFPYLTTFSGLMAVMMKIFGVNFLAVLIPNLIADLLTSSAVYSLLKRWRSKRAALIGASLSLVNPLSIIFSIQGLALSLTNLLLALSILLIYLLWQALRSDDYRKILFLATLSGLIIAFGNSVRSVFSILLIAFVLFITIWTIFKNSHQSSFYAFSSTIMLIAAFLAGSALMTSLQHNLNPYYHEEHGTLGWSIYVGANYNSKGRWSYEDWNELSPRIFDINTSQAELNADFTSRAITRYQEMGLNNIVVHFVNKSAMLFVRNEVTPIRNLEEQFTNVDGSESWYWLLNDTFYLTLTFFICATFIFFWQIINRTTQPDPFILFLALCFCGLFFSSLLVEVMSRYISIFVVPFVIFTACVITHKPKAKVSLSPPVSTSE